MKKVQQLLVGSLSFAILSAIIIIYFWNRIYPQIAYCFENSTDLQAIVSGSINEQSKSELLTGYH